MIVKDIGPINIHYYPINGEAPTQQQITGGYYINTNGDRILKLGCVCCEDGQGTFVITKVGSISKEYVF